jgi:hypothetical protein
MKASLSDEQRLAIEQTGALPSEIDDRQTNRLFFLISAEQCQKARPILDGVEDIDPPFYFP